MGFQYARASKLSLQQYHSEHNTNQEELYFLHYAIQELERFQHKGLPAVRVEFTLHVITYNLSMATALILETNSTNNR